jgi:hypothetical protein
MFLSAFTHVAISLSMIMNTHLVRRKADFLGSTLSYDDRQTTTMKQKIIRKKYDRGFCAFHTQLAFRADQCQSRDCRLLEIKAMKEIKRDFLDILHLTLENLNLDPALGLSFYSAGKFDGTFVHLS